MSVGMYGGGSDSESNGNTIMWNEARDEKAYSYSTLSEGDGSWYTIR